MKNTRLYRSLFEARYCFLLVLIILGINILTMPAMRYRGDPMAIQFETVNLLMHGDISVQSEIASRFGERGQYFYENTQKGKWYSKYGIMSTLVHVPFLWLEKLQLGALNYDSPSRLLYLNACNLILSAAIAFYLYGILALYTPSIVIRWIFILSAFYATFWWNYLRTQSSEILQCLFFLGFYYHLIFFFRGRQNDKAVPSQGFRNLLVSLVFLLALCLTKTVYILLLPVMLAWILFFSLKYGKMRSEAISYSVYLLLPALGFILLLGWLNHYKFGAPLTFGYSQWSKEAATFSGSPPEAIYGFLFSPHRSIFLHFPILLFAIFGYKAFFDKFSLDSKIILSFFIVMFIPISMFVNWQGEWCYGPRYLLFILPLLSLPFIEVLSKLKQRINRPEGIAIALGIFAVLSYSCFLQENINSLPFFTYYDVKFSILNRIHHHGAREYLESRHFGIINRELKFHKKRGELFPPLEKIRSLLDEDELKRIDYRINRLLISNYYWMPSEARLTENR